MTDSFRPLSAIAAPILARLYQERTISARNAPAPIPDQAPLQPKPGPQPAEKERS